MSSLLRVHIGTTCWLGAFFSGYQSHLDGIPARSKIACSRADYFKKELYFLFHFYANMNSWKSYYFYIIIFARQQGKILIDETFTPERKLFRAFFLSEK